MRSVAPTANGLSRNRVARTGAPAWARIAATPTARRSVLFPAMFDPLTTSSRTSAFKVTSFGTPRP